MTSALEEDFGAHLAFDRGAPGRWAVAVPEWDGPLTPLPAPELLREAVQLPELSQGGLVRYYTALSGRNFGIDSGPYPLGSCSMKYNPKVNDLVAGLPGFAGAHPLLSPHDAQGTLQLLRELQSLLGEITGFPAVSLAATAGAQGELSGILMIKKALQERGELEQRRRILVPDSAHGTNPATATMAGFDVTQIATGTDGSMDRAALAEAINESTAALMVTVPNTLGLWETGIEEVTRMVHKAGAFVYGDGANLNAIVGRIRFGDLGFDVVHLNVHKTFSTPDGGGGPGGGPVCAGEELAPYLPEPVVQVDADGTASLTRPLHSIGRVQQFHGNVGVMIRAYAYIRTLGTAGLRAVSENAVLNANYLRTLLHDHYDLPFDRQVLHEVVFSGSRQRRLHNIHTLDIAKRLIDHGFHPPTIYFPLVVDEALMIEPTETESRESLDQFAAAMIAIAEEAEHDQESLRRSPEQAPLGRLDETLAARKPVLRWSPARKASQSTDPPQESDPL